MSSIAAGLGGAPASATGILPPANPAANIAPDNSDWLTAIDDAPRPGGRGPDEHLRVGARRPADRPAGADRRERRARRPRPAADQLRHRAARRRTRRAAPTPATDPTFPSYALGRRAHHVRRIHLGRRPDLGARGRLLLDVRRRLQRLVDDQLGLQPVEPVRVLGPPRHHPAPVRQLPRAARRSSPWARRSRHRATPAAPSPRSSSARARRRRDITANWGQLASAVAVRLADGGHRADSQRDRLLGGRGQRHGRRVRLGPELRLAQRLAQRTHRGHGLDTRRQGLLAGRLRRRHLQLR